MLGRRGRVHVSAEGSQVWVGGHVSPRGVGHDRALTLMKLVPVVFVSSHPCWCWGSGSARCTRTTGSPTTPPLADARILDSDLGCLGAMGSPSSTGVGWRNAIRYEIEFAYAGGDARHQRPASL